MVPFRGRVYLYLFAGAACLSTVPALRAQQNPTVGETPQQVNDRIRTLSMGVHGAMHDYVIGVGDLVEVAVFDVPELSKDLRVSETGSISIPLVPVRLHVAGLTEIQAEEKIAEVLEANGLVTHAEVSVAVKEHRSEPITVVGAVAKPMVYQADHEVTLLEVLAEAGGIANDAGDTVIVTRQKTTAFTEIPNPQPVSSSAPAAPGSGEPPPLDPAESAAPASKPVQPETGQSTFPSAEETNQANGASPSGSAAGTPATPDPLATSITINLNDLLETGNIRNNIMLQAGDVVTVPHAGIVYVLGAVARPGGFVLSNDRTQLTTLKVLSLAGGTTVVAKLDHAVIIRKDENGKQTETQVDLKKVMHRQAEDVTMHASDILLIPDDRTKQVLMRAAEIGIAVGTAVAIFRVAYH